MKKLFMMITLCIAAIVADAQTVKPVKEYKPNVVVDASCNCYAPDKDLPVNYVITTQTFTDNKGVVYPVYMSDRGKLFVKKIAKTCGNEYNYYLNPTKP